MSDSDSLHTLIKRLTRTEKSYFKKYTSRGRQEATKYEVLFDAVASLEHYDEARVIKKMKGKTTRYLAADKNYLFHQVLEAVLAGGSRSTSLDQWRETFRKCQLLANMDMYVEAIRLLRKVMLAAEEMDAFTLWTEAVDLEIRITVFLPPDKQRSLDLLFEEKKKVIEAMRLTDEVRSTQVKLITYYLKHGIPRTAKAKKYYHDLSKQVKKVYDNPKVTLPASARIYAENTLSYYYHIIGESEQSRQHLGGVLEAIESSPSVMEYFMNLYISTLTNYCLILVYQDRFEEAAVAQKKFEAIETNNPKEAAAAFICKYNVYFQFHYRAGNHEEGYAILQQFASEEAAVGDKPINVTTFLYYYCFRAAFMVQDFRLALRWLNRILHGGEKTDRSETYVIARLSEIMVHFELEHFELVESLVQSAQKSIDQDGKLLPLEQVLLRFFADALDPAHPKAIWSLLVDALGEIQPLIEKHQVRNHFDFVAWATAHRST